MGKPLILVFGANPAWQKTLYFEKFSSGEVNRASGVEFYAGGKGVNFCRAAACRDLAETRLYQFSGGVNGALHENALRAEHIDCRAVHVAAETRCCTTCLDCSGGAMTELIEPSRAVSSVEAEEMLRCFESGLSEAAGVAITGSLPDGTAPELYTQVAGLAVKHGVPLLIDAVHAGMLDSLREFILKINMGELKKLTGEDDARTALRVGAVRWPEAKLAITDGGGSAYLAAGGKLYRYELPSIRVVSALGSGDTCSAVLLSELLNGGTVVEAFACGLAAASANCLTPRAGEFSNADRLRLMPNFAEL